MSRVSTRAFTVTAACSCGSTRTDTDTFRTKLQFPASLSTNTCTSQRFFASFTGSSSPNIGNGKGNNNGSDSDSDSNNGNHDLFKEQMQDLKDERQALFGFTDNDRDAWSNLGTSGANQQQPSDFMKQIEDLRRENQSTGGEVTPNILKEARLGAASQEQEQQSEKSPTLTHLTTDGTSVSMVDVGAKSTTRRVARAQSKVVFPPEVMVAFSATNNNDDNNNDDDDANTNANVEWVGPKGPIFATAKLAGIMAAKRTSDLIPLCHPLPLDKVHVDIRMDGNTAIIDCECRVTHKTGVEMEVRTTRETGISQLSLLYLLGASWTVF